MEWCGPCAPSKTVVVIGATGNQGGGVMRKLASTSGFKVRALTRNPEGRKAKLLEKMRNVTVVKGDLDDESSLVAAFEGAYGVFLVTSFWEHGLPEKEERQARSVASAAKKANVLHLVKSTLEFTPIYGAGESIPDIEIEHRLYKVPHFDAKGSTDHYFIDLGVPTTFLRTSFYMENLIHFGMGPKKQEEDGKYILTLPMSDTSILPMISSRDIGICAATIFKKPELIGQSFGIVGDFVTGPQLASAISEAKGFPIEFKTISFEDYRKEEFPGARDLSNMFQWQEENNEEFCARRDIEITKTLNPSVLNLKKWLTLYVKDIPV